MPSKPNCFLRVFPSSWGTRGSVCDLDSVLGLLTLTRSGDDGDTRCPRLDFRCSCSGLSLNATDIEGRDAVGSGEIPADDAKVEVVVDNSVRPVCISKSPMSVSS